MRHMLALLIITILINSGALLISSQAMAGAFEVAPTTVQLSSASPSGILHITNRGKETVYAQIEAFDWRQADMTDQLTLSHSFMISPPMARLAPGQQQTIRLMVNPDATAAAERTFRLVISELPDPAAKKQGVQVLLQFVVPVFVEGDDNSHAQLACKTKRAEDGIMMTVYNAGAHHLKLSGITATLPTGTETTLSSQSFNYLLSGSALQWKLAMASPTENPKWSVKASDEGEGALNASCLIEP